MHTPISYNAFGKRSKQLFFKRAPQSIQKALDIFRHPSDYRFQSMICEDAIQLHGQTLRFASEIHRKVSKIHAGEN